MSDISSENYAEDNREEDDKTQVAETEGTEVPENEVEFEDAEIKKKCLMRCHKMMVLNIGKMGPKRKLTIK